MMSTQWRFHQMAHSSTSGSDDDTVKLWDVDTKENITTLEGYTAVMFLLVAFSPEW